MKKTVLLLVVVSQFIFGATSEQVEKYMSLSHADRSLLEIEMMLDSMRESMKMADNNDSSQDMGIAYRDYFERHISENEMDELLALYRTPIMQLYVEETDTTDIPAGEIEAFLSNLEENPLSSERKNVIKELVDMLIDEETMSKFYKTMMQRYFEKQKRDDNGSKESKATPQEKEFISMMKNGVKQELMYSTQTLNLEELKEVNSIMKKGIMVKATKVGREAIIEIMDKFIKLILSDVKREKRG